MQIYTSSWFQYSGPGRIGISRGVPGDTPRGYRLYRALAPTRDIFKNSSGRADYQRRFLAEVLGRLDPPQVLRDLEAKSEDGLTVLLCYEQTPLNGANWCHRSMVADWLRETTGVEVAEWNASAAADDAPALLR
jgi:hypothetical protein